MFFEIQFFSDSRPSSFLGGFGSHNNTAQLNSATPSFASPNPSITIVNTSRIPSILSPSTSGYVLVCEACKKPSFFSDENQLRNVRENLSLRRLLEKYALNNTIENSVNSKKNKEQENAKEAKPPNCQVF